jgi:hypothetical protein
MGKCFFGGSRGSVEDAMWYSLEKTNDADSSGRVQTAPPRQNVAVFPQSGMCVARTEHAEILFFAVPNGICGKGSHTHNDKLSFVLRLDGEEVLCDSGTGTYTRDPKMRNRFRATSAHNTVVIDGQEQNTIDGGRRGLFCIGTEARVSRIEEATENGDIILRASHKGYERFGVTHTRTIRLSAGKNEAIVEDQLGGDGRHSFEINFQLTPRWKISSVENLESEIRARISGTRELRICFQGPNNIHGQQEESRISVTYGATIPNNRLRFWGESTFPTTLTTIVSWTTQSSDTTDLKKAGVHS